MNGPMYAGILDTIRALPGVESVAQSQYPIADGDHGLPYVAIPGSPKQPDEDRSVYYESVSPGFFQTVGMPIMAGRGFTEEDQSHPVAIVNETLARRFFNGEAVGRRISITKDALVPEPQGTDLIEIVGVVRDARYTTVRDTGLPGVFVSGLLPGAGSYAVRTSIDPAAVASSIAPALADIKRFSVRNVRTQDEVTAATFVRERHFAAVSSVFGGLALLLTGIGLFGLVSYSVARRTREIGVRVALGATGRRIVGSLVRETLLLAAVGVAAGILAALAMSRVVQSLLYGLGPADPMILGGAAVVTLLIAMIAAAVPARRAASVDPLIALRSE
jgi:predicted permease